jgi:hypothetical protein
MSVVHLVSSVHGMIHQEWLALNDGAYSLLIEEEGNGTTWLLIYDWDGGWEMSGSFRMGLARDYEGEVMPGVGRIVDVGESSMLGSDQVLVVEEVEGGFWVLMYEWSFFWEIWNFQASCYISGGRYVYDDAIGESGLEGKESKDEEEPDEEATGGWDEDTLSLSAHDYLDL